MSRHHRKPGQQRATGTRTQYDTLTPSAPTPIDQRAFIEAQTYAVYVDRKRETGIISPPPSPHRHLLRKTNELLAEERERERGRWKDIEFNKLARRSTRRKKRKK